MFQIPHDLLHTTTHWTRIACSAASSKELYNYKVVLTYCRTDKDILCCIVTVGVDKSWRRVCTQHLSPASKDLICHASALTAPGFIHCVCMSTSLEHSHSNCVLTLNVETETFAENPIPQGLEKRLKLYLSTGKSLSLFLFDWWDRDVCYEVWDMESATGEWTKMDNIDLRPHMCKLKELCFAEGFNSVMYPVGRLKHQEVAALRFSQPARFHIAYNVRTHEFRLV